MANSNDSAASSKPVLVKLGWKPEHETAMLRVPSDQRNHFREAKGARPVLGKVVDFVVAFYQDQGPLKQDLAKVKKALSNQGMFWVCWPKGNVTTLNRDVIAGIAQRAELEAVANVSIDDEWSALRLMHPKTEREPEKKAPPKKAASKSAGAKPAAPRKTAARPKSR